MGICIAQCLRLCANGAAVIGPMFPIDQTPIKPRMPGQFSHQGWRCLTIGLLQLSCRKVRFQVFMGADVLVIRHDTYIDFLRNEMPLHSG